VEWIEGSLALGEMGYDLHITRAALWAENDGTRISAEEWLGIVDGDDELTLTPENGPYFAAWRGGSMNAEPWFDWDAGNVYTKNPDSATLRKMIQLANKLRARVQGDDGEFYTGEEPLDEYRTR
jgi:hypothetical protein